MLSIPWTIMNCQSQRILICLQRTRISRRRRTIWLLPQPLSRQKARPATHRKTEKERQLVDGRDVWGDGGGAQSFYSEKAWSFRNHSILSGRSTQPVRAYILQCTDAESKNNLVYGTLRRSGLKLLLMSTPESTPTHLPWATLCRSRP